MAEEIIVRGGETRTINKGEVAQCFHEKILPWNATIYGIIK